MPANRSKKYTAGALLTIATLAVPTAVSEVAADPGPCNNYLGCAASGGGGSGYNYQFNTNDTHLDNNYWTGGWFKPTVNNSISSLRNRKSWWDHFCGYNYFNYGGGVVVDAPYEATWVNAPHDGTSSVRFRDGSC